MQTKSTTTATTSDAAAPPSTRALTRIQLVRALGERLPDLTRQDIDVVFDALAALVRDQLKAAGQVTLPGLVKIRMIARPATARREGTDPFTKQPRIFEARPASKTVRVNVLKALRDAVA